MEERAAQAMQRQQAKRCTRLISFSGIDGAGKSTQIEKLCAHLRDSGLSFQLISFWESAARFTGLRENAGRAVFGGDRGVGTPAAPINRRDKNVRSWMMTCVRLLLYFADAVSLRLLIGRARASGVDALIFDRYIYDELANLPLQNPLVRIYSRAIAALTPKPDVRFLLDADPARARARKPEYPLEFLHINRRSYFMLGELIGGFTIIAPAPIREVEKEILECALKAFANAPDPRAEGAGWAPMETAEKRREATG
jgi:thymidylate kinase